MAPKKTTAAKAKAKGKGPVVVQSGEPTDHIFAKPAFKQSRPPRSSFDRNIQKLLELRDTTEAAESEPTAGPSGPVIQDEAPKEDAAKLLRRLDSILKEVTQLRRSVLSTGDISGIEDVMNGIDSRSDTIEDTVNDIQATVNSMDQIDSTVDEIRDFVDGIDTRTDNIEDTVNDIQATVNSMDMIDSRTENVEDMVTQMQHVVDNTATNITDAENAIRAARMDATVYYQSLRDRMDLMDEKMDTLMNMVAQGY